MNATHRQVREYYRALARGRGDLVTNACCCVEDSAPRIVREILQSIAPEIKESFYGCGSPLPPLLEGLTVLDLGCGSGRDVYVASKLVGEHGRVIGVDMTAEQIEVAERHREEQAQRFGYSQSNVAFHQGYIEDLGALGIGDESVDVVISNCVINLSPFKDQVFSEVYRVLRPGGEFFFSDIFADRRLSADAANDLVLLGECLGGALYVEDFRRLLAAAGWLDSRYTNAWPVSLGNEEIEHRVGMVEFSSRTVRAFKLASLEDVCEDYGQVAYYKGTIPDQPHFFDLDDHHRFFTGKPLLVCGNTAEMLQETRFASSFSVIGDRSVHYGRFDCSANGGTGKVVDESAVCSC
jgi:SAM-dependent methyltransferase